jgi:hypothetical protein
MFFIGENFILDLYLRGVKRFFGFLLVKNIVFNGENGYS